MVELSWRRKFDLEESDRMIERFDLR
jgi:hypothetical protein